MQAAIPVTCITEGPFTTRYFAVLTKEVVRSGGVMSAFRLFVLLIISSWLGCGPALAEKRVALVIGNSAYQKVAKLSNPAHDASVVTAMLKAAGFNSMEVQAQPQRH